MKPAFAVVAWAVAAAALAFVSPLEELELRLLDLQFGATRASGVSAASPADERVVVVGIDDRSVGSITEPVGLWHGYLARFLEAMKQAPPELVAFDVVMPDRSFEGIAPGFDRVLLRALISTRSAFPTFLAITVKDDRRPRGIHPSFISAAGTKPGFVLWPVDRDGRIRRFDEELGERGERVDTLVGVMARRLGKAPDGGYLDYAFGKPIAYIPFIDVLAAAERNDTEWLRTRFAGRAVLLGMVLPFTDSVRVPVELAAWPQAESQTPGVLLHAHALRTILADRLIKRAPETAVALLTLLAALAAVLATSPTRAVAIAVIALAALPVAAVVALRQAVFLPVAWPLAAALAAVALRQGFDVGARLAERRRLRSSFSGAVSPVVMDEILAGRLQPQQGGVNMTVCILFSDIRGYTTLSEGKSPGEIVALLNRYFDRMVNVIHDCGGTVMSFIGDGIMAVFGAPQPLPNASEAGFRAAVRMLEEVRVLSRELQAEGLPPIAIGVGLHLGEAVVGHVGSKTRHDYTAIGDVTNVASRLESATKETGYRIVVSREVAEQLAQRSELTPLGPVALKGHQPVEAYGYVKVE